MWDMWGVGWWNSIYCLDDKAVSILAGLIFGRFLVLVVSCPRARSPRKNQIIQKATTVVHSTYYLCCIRRVKCLISIIRRYDLALGHFGCGWLCEWYVVLSRAFSCIVKITSYRYFQNVTHTPKKNFLGFLYVVGQHP